MSRTVSVPGHEPFAVASPWWAHVEPVAQRLGPDRPVLRLVSVSGGEGGRDGLVRYQVEPGEPVADHPLRAPWARPGGPGALLDWAGRELDGLLRGDPVQVKTWNLSCVYRLDTVRGTAWLKASPAWAADEAAAICLVRRHAPELVPEPLATAPYRTVTLGANGVSWRELGARGASAVVRDWVAVQAALAGSVPGAPLDVRREFRRFDGFAVEGLPELAARLPELLAELAGAGLPDTLVHGDLHPGNWVSDGTRHAVIDWSDHYQGNPAADITRLTGWLPEDQVEEVADTWVRAWRERWPGSRPERALAPMRVLGPVLDAITYQRFLDNIEPSERVYHENDPVDELTRAVAELV
ncbi:hypothetical protein BC739_003361 [Kutzneria viridogrisea]|uniref:Aminoglycoside phosphotransferase domain-containing protein n=1 Tax=Kutzneria viridogrisea TaxID=47990 RepID=A0ABR6BH03_9PSEU|nr:hypothetical protein [Kutzneria viridogrisea]